MKDLNDSCLHKQQSVRKYGLSELNIETYCSPILKPTKKKIRTLDLGCITYNKSTKEKTKAQEIFDSKKELIKIKLVKLTSPPKENTSLKLGCSVGTKEEIQQQNCNVKIPISKSNKLISDIKVEELDDSFEHSLSDTNLNIAKHNLKKKEFSESQKGWEKEKNIIRKSLEIHDNLLKKEHFLSDKHLADSISIHDRISSLNKLYWNSMNNTAE